VQNAIKASSLAAPSTCGSQLHMWRCAAVCALCATAAVAAAAARLHAKKFAWALCKWHFASGSGSDAAAKKALNAGT